MAKVFSYSPIYALLFVFLIVIASTEIGMVEGNHKLCGKRCEKCEGDCRKEDCNDYCIKYEGAKKGDCYKSDCYCYFKCDD